MTKNFLFNALLIATTSLSAQIKTDNWTSISEQEAIVSGKREIVPEKYKVFHLNFPNLKSLLSSAPSDKSVLIKNSLLEISLPMPDGTLQKFKVVEAPVMAAELQVSFPNIKTYSIHGVDDAYASGKIDVTEFGFHGMIRSPNGDVFIDPFCRNNTSDYVSYYTYDFKKPDIFKIPEVGVITDEINQTKKTANTAALICAGVNLRTYRLAVACTGEYAVAATGFASPTTSQTLAKVVTSVNRVDGVYESEVAIRMVLVPTTTLVLFTTPGTGFTTAENNSSTSLIGKSQSIITTNIGSANFDIGHTFSTGGGGLANLGCVCSNSSKASGITGSSNPVGDPYDIDYVAHEMGHQFSGNHTFNANSGAGSCSGNRNGSTSVEPGSGVTIMAYAGICGAVNDLASNSIAYFHGVSFDEIMNFTTNNGGSSCDVLTISGNNPPSVTVMANITTSPNTPFTLTGSATDPDGDALTYQWEEMDAGTGSGGNWNSGAKPFYQSYAPIASATRSFPSAAVISSGNLQGTRGEFTPTTAQVLKFRLTARDNKMGGGGVCSATTQVTVVNFSVTSQGTAGIVYTSGSTQVITWAMNGTNVAPISCANVNIYFSLNSGTTYSLVLANTPNDGTENIAMPTVTANIATCMVKVQSSTGPIFFDANNVAFTVSNNTGIVQTEANTIQMLLYPNPFSGSVQISITNPGTLNAGNTKLNVYDVLGHLVKTEKIKVVTNYTETFDLTELANGTYMVEITDGKQRSVSRMVKL